VPGKTLQQKTADAVSRWENQAAACYRMPCCLLSPGGAIQQHARQNLQSNTPDGASNW
jgi:hypothetical protein